MLKRNRIKIIVTLGPATKTEKDVVKLKDKGVDLVRINMSHSVLEDLRYFIDLAKKVDIPFIVDTEGAQIRVGDLIDDVVEFREGDIVKICAQRIIGSREKINLTPLSVVKQLEAGSLLFFDFNTLVMKIADTTTIKDGYILARVVTSGRLGKNKAVIVVSWRKQHFNLPVLTEKDKQSIKLGIEHGVRYVAVSYVRRGEDIDEVRKFTDNKMLIISKIEAKESLENLEPIIERSDAILVDRGDLSKEVPVEKIPFIQKLILKKAHTMDTPVYIATNLLESMIDHKKPTRAEVNDVVNTILDGADGLILSAETALGKHPMECINMMRRLIRHSELVKNIDTINYFSDTYEGTLIPPHGGKLIERFIDKLPPDINRMKKIKLREELLMDIEQIAIGGYSPLEGFMCQEDFDSVLDHMRLKNGIVWPLPIILDISQEQADVIKVGDDVALVNDLDDVMAILHVEDKFKLDKCKMINKVYGTTDSRHPGVKMVLDMNPILLGGKIDLFRRRSSPFKEYELTPRQTRQLFNDKNWIKIVGFHTRNVIHRGHEFIQLAAMERFNCDGLFVHPVVGKKKKGDFCADYIVKSYEKMIQDIYPPNSVVFAIFPVFSRYAGPREAVFTALCRQNFGCTHFIIGRDHTGVGNYYHPYESHKIFNEFPDIKIKPVKFDTICYSTKYKKYLERKDIPLDRKEDFGITDISGTVIRDMLKSLKTPPDWMMRTEISSIILEALNNKEKVFIGE